MNTNDNGYSKYNKYGDSDFSWQKDCIEKIKNSSNVILSSPTGSGKTKVFLEWAKQKSKNTVIITAPIKALSNQRYRELKEDRYIVGLETGDIKNVPDNCDFICCTQEIYTNKYSELDNITLIMDEFHYIFENSNRARTYVDALHNSKASNILLCSATLGDMNKLNEYVNDVSGREFLAYENHSRLTSLFFEENIELENIENSLVVTFSRKNIDKILNMLYCSRNMQEEKILEKIEELAKKDKINNSEIIQCAKKGIAGYYGALLPKEKLFIEKCFENGMIDTVVGTDALALGVNFPVENVIFTQLAKYYDGPISKNLFEQLAGRAGRKGYFDEGHVYYCLDFAQFCESYEYNTQNLFEEILRKPNEDVSINLTPNIKNILLEKATIEEEAEFISKFSTENVDVDYKYSEILLTIDYIKNLGFEEEVKRIINENLEYSDWDEKNNFENDNIENLNKKFIDKKEEFDENIAKVYFDEYSPVQNCRIFTDILCGMAPDEILERYGTSGSFADMLQFRKYVKSLPKRYRKGLTKINDKIREIDETAIDEYRGSILVDNITEQLEKYGKLEGKNVIQVLENQEKLQKIDGQFDEVLLEKLNETKGHELEEY